MQSSIYLSTGLLESARWSRDKHPRLKLSQWIPAIRAAGFDGLELWENHILKATEDEVAAVYDSGFPIAVWNSYAGFDDGEAASREATLKAASESGAGAIKFNLGNDLDRLPVCLINLIDFARKLPRNVALFCECHANTVLEHVEDAAPILLEINERIPVKVIVHPFNDEFPPVDGWFDALGPLIVHAHVQTRHPVDLARILSIRSKKKLVREVLERMRDRGYDGTFSLEFTEGIRTAADEPETLMKVAAEDLLFLREEIARL